MRKSPGKTNAEMTEAEELVTELQKQLRGKRYILVLDDVWNENRDKWDRLRICLQEIGGSQGSKVLVTTRSDTVASIMQASRSHHLKDLSNDYSWMLFEKLAFAYGGASKTQALVDLGRRILSKCGGVPLAIKAIGSMLNSMKEESEWLMIEKSELWSQSTNIETDGVFSALKLSYEHLPSLSLKPCFASCSIFPKDTRLRKEILIQIWMAQGYIKCEGQLEMEDVGSNYFNILLRRSLLQDPERDSVEGIVCCKMHDLVHGWPKLTSLPEQIQHLSTLRTLKIGKFDCLEALPEWIGRFQHLEELSIYNCANLEELSSAEAMQHLTNLQKLKIDNCPVLIEGYTTGSDREWHKIAQGLSSLRILEIQNFDCLETLPEWIGRFQHLEQLCKGSLYYTLFLISIDLLMWLVMK